ncbi:MAG TPA: Ig-like domain-containing protein [Longimicrobiales bacterium]|nr:Ig-like domain-containing protein [Longimicrobiales bacterium]
MNCSDVVDPNPPVGIVLAPTSTILEVGDTNNVTVTVYGKTGELVRNPTITWRSSDPAIVDVLGSGLIVGKAPGNVTVTASIGGATDSIFIQVRPRSTSLNNRSCTETGARHFGVNSSGTWSAASSPHFIRDTLVVTDLTIEAGALICAFPDARIVVKGKLTAIGSTGRPIRFLPADTTHGWTGIHGAIDPTGFEIGSIVFSHVRIDDARSITGIQLQIDSSSFSRTGIFADGNFNSLTLRNSTVEDGNIALANGTFANTVVRRGNVELSYNKHGSRITVDGGRIEDSPGTALTVGSPNAPGAPTLTIVNPLKITGSRGAIALIPPEDFFKLWPTPQLQDELLSNQNKSITLWSTGSGTLPELRLRKGFAWQIETYLSALSVGRLTLDAGLSLDIEGFLDVNGPVVAVGSSAEPIVITTSAGCHGVAPRTYALGCALRLGGSASSTISYVKFDKAPLIVGQNNTARIDHIDSNSFVTVGSPNSSIIDLNLHDLSFDYFPPSAALRLAGRGVIAQRVAVRRFSSLVSIAAISIEADDVQILDCDVSDNTGDGVVVISGVGAQIHNCNIERNAGLGVNNRATIIVDAKRNWWGDPAGPNGPNGDGVAGAVDSGAPLPVKRPTPSSADSFDVIRSNRRSSR